VTGRYLPKLEKQFISPLKPGCTIDQIRYSPIEELFSTSRWLTKSNIPVSRIFLREEWGQPINNLALRLETPNIFMLCHLGHCMGLMHDICRIRLPFTIKEFIFHNLGYQIKYLYLHNRIVLLFCSRKYFFFFIIQFPLDLIRITFSRQAKFSQELFSTQ
jgi:hypothetical protein